MYLQATPRFGSIPTPVTIDSAHESSREVGARLMQSAAQLSYDPATEVDWEADLDPSHYGLNPEWSTLYGTRLWGEMRQEQRVALTRHEVASIMSTGIWFEMILQQMVLRDQYVRDATDPRFQFALTEIADECRHSIMFARACEKMGVPGYLPDRLSVELGRVFKAVASGEVAYAGILAAEEILDVMQRDWMRGENVLPLVRTTSRIHVVEESRHMSFARDRVRQVMRDAGPKRRLVSSIAVATATSLIVRNMVNDQVYAAAGLDTDLALREARRNRHHHAMLRTSCTHLMTFLDSAGLLTPPAVQIYKRLHLI